MRIPKTAIVIGIIVSCLLVALQSYVKKIEFSFLSGSGPFLKAATAIHRKMVRPNQSPSVCLLAEKTAMIESQLVRMTELELENERLRNLLKFKKNLSFRTVAARVIGRGISNWSSIVIIDKGSEDGLSVNTPLMLEEGIVGKIIEVGARESKAVLLIDPNLKVPAIIQRSRVDGLVTGGLDRQCQMIYLSPDADVVVGDKVVTSGLSRIFPKGIAVGEIARIERGRGDQYLTAIVKPYVNFSKVEEVLCIE